MRSAKPSTTAVLPTPASPVRIGLFCRRRIRMSTTWRISKSRPSTGSILPFLRVLGQIDGELIEVGRLAAHFRRARSARRGARSRGRRQIVSAFGRICHDRRQLLAQRFRLDFLQFLADVAHHARQLFIGHQRQNGEAGAHLPRAELERADGPALRVNMRMQRRAERRRARVAGFQLVEAARQFRRPAALCPRRNA